MKAIIILMLAVQIGIFLATTGAVLFARAGGERRPIWANFAIALLVVSGASWNIGNMLASQAPKS
jgi:hypothetical protein